MATVSSLEKQVKTIGKLLNISTKISVDKNGPKYLTLDHFNGYKLRLNDPSNNSESTAFNLPEKRFTAEKMELILTGIITGIKVSRETNQPE